MSRTPGIPSYQLHKATGLARVRVRGKDIWLGKHGTPESLVKYDEVIAELLQNREGSGARTVRRITVTALMAQWWVEAKRRYAGRGKGMFGNAGNWRTTIKMLREAYGDLPADDLGPKKVRDLIEATAKEQGWSRTYARDHMNRIRIIYKWAVSEELVDVASYERLRTVTIRAGKHTEAAGPVSDELVDKTLPLLKPRIAAMVQLLRLTAMRPNELVQMQVDDVDRSGDVWVYRVREHKTKYRGKVRCVFLGPRAQEVLGPWLLKASNFVFPASGRGGSPYTTDSLRRSVQRTTERYGIERWTLYQLRKSAASSIRSALDVEHAASVLGHSSSVVTQDHYARASESRAISAAKKLG